MRLFILPLADTNSEVPATVQGKNNAPGEDRADPRTQEVLV